MKFLSLKIQNFLAIGDSGPLSLNERGLCLIQGVNGDDTSAGSNGSGKSSIVDALAWCLYGTTARGISGDSVVNNVAKKNTAVEVTVKDGSTTYFISRHRKHEDYKNSLIIECLTDSNPAIIDLTKGTDKETQELVNQIMGCSLEVFMAAVYAGQETMPDLPKMTDKQLKMLIEEAAGVERLEQAYAKARENKLIAESRLNSYKNDLESRQKNLATTELDIHSKKLEIDGFESLRATRKKEELEKAAQIQVEMSKILREVKSRNEDVLKKEADDINKRLASHDSLKKKANLLLEEVHQKGRLATQRSTHLDGAIIKAKEIKARLENATESVKQPCMACGKPGDEHDLETFKKHTSNQLKEALLDLKAKKQLHESTELELVLAKKNYDDFSSTIPDVSVDSARLNTINKELSEISRFKNDVRLLMANYDTHAERAHLCLTETNPHWAGLDKLKIRRDGLLSEISLFRTAVEKAQKQLSICESVVKVFGPAGVRAHILDTVTPFLNDRTADYLSALSDGNITAVWSTLSATAKGELKEKFNIEVSNDKGADSFAGLSGGEKRKVRLATMLALQDLVASRATKNIELYMADEIDDALDPAGLERLMTVLDRKAKERGTVLVISHNELSDWIPQVCTVTKSGGKSTIEGALSL